MFSSALSLVHISFIKMNYLKLSLSVWWHWIWKHFYIVYINTAYAKMKIRHSSRMLLEWKVASINVFFHLIWNSWDLLSEHTFWSSFSHSPWKSHLVSFSTGFSRTFCETLPKAYLKLKYIALTLFFYFSPPLPLLLPVLHSLAPQSPNACNTTAVHTEISLALSTLQEVIMPVTELIWLNTNASRLFTHSGIFLLIKLTDP